MFISVDKAGLWPATGRKFGVEQASDVTSFACQSDICRHRPRQTSVPPSTTNVQPAARIASRRGGEENTEQYKAAVREKAIAAQTLASMALVATLQWRCGRKARMHATFIA